MECRNVPLSLPCVGEAEAEAVSHVLQSGWLAQGPEVKVFERDFAAYIGVDHAVALNSATSALQLALIAHGASGEVILPSFTFSASANAVVTAGCTPVFADIDAATLCINPIAIEEAVSRKTIAIMPVHFAGQACDMASIMELAEKHGLMVLEDSAEAIGATYKEKKAGAYGTGCFSFFPTKNMTCGEGGMLTTNDANLAERVRTLRGHGIASTTYDRLTEGKPWAREATMPGYNFRMPDILAAVARVQLNKLDAMNEKRRSHASWLNEQLRQLEGVRLPFPPKDGSHVYQMYTVILNPELYDRDAIVLGMRQQGVHASVHFDPPVHQQRYYRDNFVSARLPVTESIAKSIVTLPLFPDMTKAMLGRVVNVFTAALETGKRSA